jgi:photosystem II stability/assembly factor-like uncharacterized protein
MMNKRWFAITIPVASAITALIIVLWLMGDISSGISTPALAAPLSLTVSAVEPDSAPNDIDTPILIHGTGFTATLLGTEVITAPIVYLGDSQLAEVSLVNSTTLSATVLWGLEPGVYTLSVENPDGEFNSLADAFSVTDALGEYVTGGPYGGQSVQLALKPNDPSSIYATMFGVGLFISEDAAGTWEPLAVYDSDWPIHLDFDSQDPNILYYGTASNMLYRSMDNGISWEISGPSSQNGCFLYPVAHPSLAGVVFVGMGGCGDGVFYSTDYGVTWNAHNTGLSDLDVRALAIHPKKPEYLLAGTQEGHLFYSIDGSDSWIQTTQLTGTVTRLYFNPFAEELEAWAITKSEAEGRGYLYRSTNLTDWTTLDLNVQPQGGTIHAQMTFLPGSVWLASISVYSSTNSGATWNALDGPQWQASAIAISPDNPQEIYVGTDFGVAKSSDGGKNWQEVNDGLAALMPHAVAVAPDDPDIVYVDTHQSIFASHNGGNDWYPLNHGYGSYPFGSDLAVDQFSSTQLYLTAECPGEFCIDISPDRGATWNIVTATLPTAYEGWYCGSFAITPSPHTPGRVLVGASVSPGEWDRNYVGIFFRSDDYGVNWQYIEPPQPVKRINEIAYDAFNPDLIYAATYDTGLWRSTDGGDNWQQVPVADVQPPITVSAIAVHPNVPDKVYIRTQSFADPANPEVALWVSDDAGATWQPFTYDFLGDDLLIAPPLPEQFLYSLYTGCEAGLCRSIDDGATWVSMDGVPRPEILTAATDGERAIIYMGTPGGLVNSAGVQSALSLDTIPGRGSVFGGGVYRLATRLPSDYVFLPSVMRASTP